MPLGSTSSKEEPMRLTSLAKCLLLVLALTLQCTSAAVAQTLGAGPSTNYEKVALLKWYPASQTGATISVSANPFGMAFDGANMWVTSGNSVTKLQAADGGNPIIFVVGANPTGVAFDGTNI